MKNAEIEISDKIYYVLVPETDEEFKIGLSKHTELAQDEGMLFCYDSPQRSLTFTMAETKIPLDIIFIDDDKEVISVRSVQAEDPNPIKERYVQYVLEVPINSGIVVGDTIDEFSDDITEEDRNYAKENKMLVLDENGDVQMRLEGGERIVSRIETRKLIKQALKAYKTDADSEYIKLGRMIFRIIKKQDNREPEYVERP